MEKRNCDCISGIICEATNCTYNEEKHCTASCIQVGGTTAKTSCETECNTFKTK